MTASGRRSFELAVVCTGNRARSAFAKALFDEYLYDENVVVRSAGTLDLGPLPALPEAVRAAHSLGIDLTAHRAAPLHHGALAYSDLVIGFEPSNLSAAIVDGGADRARVFSIVELADILVHIDSMYPTAARSSPTQKLELANRHRRGGLLSTPSVTDPYGRSEATFHATLERIHELVSSIALSLFGVDRARERFGGRTASSWHHPGRLRAGLAKLRRS